MKFVIHILKALDISYRKMQEKIEITKNHLLQFWTKIPKNGYCDIVRHFLSLLKLADENGLKINENLASVPSQTGKFMFFRYF